MKLVVSDSWGVCAKHGISITMPEEYTDHLLCKQMQLLAEEDLLQDAVIIFRESQTKMKVSAFMLSLTSPVFHKMVCGAFKESVNKEVRLEEAEERAFRKVLDLACGRNGIHVNNLDEVIELATLADRFQMSQVVAALEDVALHHLSVDDCAHVLTATSEGGLSRLHNAGRSMALLQFEAVAATPGFLSLTEDMLAALLQDDRLVARSEESVFEALVGWMAAGGAGGWRGSALLAHIRFPLMHDNYLAIRARSAMPDPCWLDSLLLEAFAIKHVDADERGRVPLQRLGARALVPRVGRGVAWDRYAHGGERRLAGHGGQVHALAACGAGRVCSSADDGTILVWNRATLEQERALEADGAGSVGALAVWEGWLISGHGNGRIRVWDVATGRCDRVLEGHVGKVHALAVWGSRLVSGADDRKVKLWALGTAAAWPCERTLSGHTNWVASLAVWAGRVLSGSEDCTIRVWDAATGAAEATLRGHTNGVTALAPHGERLVSAGWDGTLRVWALGGGWALLRSIQAYPPSACQFPYRLAVSGSKLLSASIPVDVYSDDDRRYEVRVWDLETLEGQRALPQPARVNVWALLGLEGEVWAGVGREVVVWGRD